MNKDKRWKARKGRNKQRTLQSNQSFNKPQWTSLKYCEEPWRNLTKLIEKEQGYKYFYRKDGKYGRGWGDPTFI